MDTRKVILVADDETVLRDLLRKLLDDEGYEVLDAADGNKALDMSRAHDGVIDLLLTDVEMPHMDGIAAYRQMSAERSNIKVLFISGADREDLDIPEGLAFLRKPFVSIAEIRSKVRELLSLSTATDGKMSFSGQGK